MEKAVRQYIRRKKAGAIEAAPEVTPMPHDPDAEAAALDRRKPEDWLREMFPSYVREFAPHHHELWEWVWSIKKDQPVESFVAIWPRGGAKSTSAELACVALGAKRARRYGLYISMTQAQADDHVQNIASLLESDAIAKNHPDLGNRMVGKFGNARGWRRNRLRTESGFTIDAIGLDTAARGVKLEEQRPDFMVIDDVDSEVDSAAAVEKKIKILTKKLLPSGSSDLAVLAVQNLVHANSIFSRLADGRADFLADRTVSGPFPAVRRLSYEKRDDGTGTPRYVITGGEPIWSGQDLQACQQMIDRDGLHAFLTECQQEVAGAEPGAIFREWNETFHVITWSEFSTFYGDAARDVYGRPRIPAHWLLARGQDWGTTEAHPCATVWVARPGRGDRLADSVFVYRELVVPEYPVPATDEPVTPKRVGMAIVEAERPWNEATRMSVSLMSHEASTALNTYTMDMPPGYKLRFAKWKPDRRAGIAVLQNYMEINKDQPHPFRPRLMGRPRIYLIVADDEGELYYDGDGRLCVKAARTGRGLVRLRAEIPAYHYPQAASGNETEYPEKRFDDAIDPLRAIADVFFPRSARMTDEERFEATLPDRLKREAVAALPPEQRFGADFCRQTMFIEHQYNQKQKRLVGWRQALKEKYRDKP
jgi:hypothetical protein